MKLESGNINRIFGRYRLVLFAAVLLGLAGFVLSLSAQMPQSGPDLNVKVTTFEPSGRTDITGNITVKFSRDMVPDDSLDQPVFDAPIQFDPPIPGIARWVEKSILRFFPDGPLKPATEYTARVKSSKTYLYGNRINDNREFKFQTPFLEVTYAYNESSPVKDKPEFSRLGINIGFNYPLDAEDLSDFIEIKGGDNAVKDNLKFEVREKEAGVTPRGRRISRYDEIDSYRGTNDFIISSEPFELTNEVQRYELIIKKGLRCIECTLPLQENYSNNFLIDRKQRLVINRVWPNGSGGGFQIRAFFNLPINPETAADYVKIDGVEPSLYAERNVLVMRGDFEPGKTYEVVIEKGMPAADGLPLETRFSTIITVPDMAPSIRFTANGRYLTQSGNGLIEIESVNIDKITVEVEQIFPNNIVHFLKGNYGRYNAYGSRLASLGRSFFTRDYDLQYTKNVPLKSTVDIAGITGDKRQGIFKVSVRAKNRRWTGDSRFLMETDIGLSARLADDYLMVWANSLKDTKPVANAKVSLISGNNQTLIEGNTDSRGIVSFDNLAGRIKGFEPYLIVVTKNNDMSYLQFDQARLPIADFDVGGRPLLTSGYEAFIYTDRGIYRPGDTAHIVSIIKGAGVTDPPDFPYFITLYDPRGNKYQEFKAEAGGESLDINNFVVPSFAGTGKYRIAARIGEDYEIGQADFLVEEFMPDRIKVIAKANSDSYLSGNEMTLDVTGKYLFGPPTSGHKVSGHITIEPENFSAQGYSDYTFHDKTRKFSKMEIDLPDTVLDHEGRFQYHYGLPDDLTAPSMLKGLLSATVSEQGGRAVGGYDEVKIFPYYDYVGLRLDFKGYAKIGQPVDYSVAALDYSGYPASLDSIEVTVYRLVYHSVLKETKGGLYRYVSEESAHEIESRMISVVDKPIAESFTPQEYGRFRIVAHDLRGGHASSVTFYASGWGYAPWAMTDPDRLELGLDKDLYSPGDKAIVQVRAPFGGKLLLTIEKNEVLEYITVEMEDNTAEVELQVKNDYFPNVYITGTLIKPADEIEQTLPARAFGIVPLVLSNERKKIAVNILAPDEIKPNSKLPLEIHLGEPRSVEMTIAAVDVGILQLTDFRAPDPLEFFHGKKRPYLNPYDIYSFIFPEIEARESNLSPSGGRMFAETRKRHLNPIRAQRIRPVALWSGLIRTDDEGNANLNLDIPQFNGALRIMAVAAEEDNFGSANKEVLVRDKIVIQESFPRFTAPLDFVEGLVSIFNNTGEERAIDVSLKLDGPAELQTAPTHTITVKDNSEAVTRFRFKTGLRPGKINCSIIAKGGGDSSRVTFELPNRPYHPPVTEFGSGQVVEDSTVAFTLPDDWVEGTDHYVIQTSSNSFPGLARGLEYLLRYPYGCIEQTTSRIMPLLYFENLVNYIRPDLIGTRGHEYFVQEGLLRLMEFQNDDGSFGFWPGAHSKYFNPWASIYAAHCVVEAKRAGYSVDSDFYKKTVAFVRDIARGKENKSVKDIHKNYAAYVLAKGGIIEKRSVNHIKSLNPRSIAPYGRYMMADVMALAGETDYAKELLPETIEPATFSPETGGSFSSGVRSTAILLDVLMDIDPGNPGTSVLARDLSDHVKTSRWYTTQSTAFALMALGRYLADKPIADFKGEVEIDSDGKYDIDTSLVRIRRDDLAGKKVSIKIDGRGICFYAWQASGVKTGHAAEEYERGIHIVREYFDEDGNPIDTASVELGSRIICVVTAVSVSKYLSYVVINDMIPAGFEIENPRLKTTPRLSWISKVSTDYQHMDIRDDRMLYFTDLRVGAEKRFYYSLRAISVGDFAVPPVMAECMYNPAIAAAASSGRIKIIR